MSSMTIVLFDNIAGIGPSISVLTRIAVGPLSTQSIGGG